MNVSSASLSRRVLKARRASPWNRLKVEPFQTCIRYQSVEEPPARILVVEDDPLVRELLVEALREES